MLVLLNQAWPWIIVGVLLISWGIFSLQLKLMQWIKIGVSILFNNFGDQTKQEKRVLAATPLDEAMASNLGCTLVLVGLASLGYGVIQWLK